MDEYVTGGLLAAKNFNCYASTPSYIRKISYYETAPSQPFNLRNVYILELSNWAELNSCR